MKRSRIVYKLPGGAVIPLRVDTSAMHSRPYWAALRPRAGESLRVYPYHSHFVTCLTHWIPNERRTLLCRKNIDGQCVQCGVTAARLVGYAVVYWSGDKLPRLLQITAGAIDHEPRLNDGATDLFARQLIVTRGKKSNRDLVRVEITDQTHPQLPRGKMNESDVMDQLQHMWQIAVEMEEQP